MEKTPEQHLEAAEALLGTARNFDPPIFDTKVRQAQAHIDIARAVRDERLHRLKILCDKAEAAEGNRRWIAAVRQILDS